MPKLILTIRLALLGACISLVGCASTQPTAYSGLASASQLRPDAADKSGHIPYSVSTTTNWHSYTSAIVAPVELYKGIDAQFENVSEEDKAVLARTMNEEFKHALQKRFSIVESAAPNTLLVKATLTGGRTTTRFISTVTRLDIFGAPYNIVQAIRGKEGSFTGSVSYAVEIFDATNHTLLDAYVTKQFPNAMNVAASLGALDASITGIQKGAVQLAQRLE